MKFYKKSKSKSNKVISLLLVLSMVLAMAIPFTAFAQDTLPKVESVKVVPDDFVSGVVDLPYEEGANNADIKMRTRATLPQKYDLITAGKMNPREEDQGKAGTCWTFAALGSIESALFKEDPNLDLSQRHLAYFSTNTQNNPANPSDGTIGDYFVRGDWINSGGNYQKATGALARGIGPITEDKAPYNSPLTAPDESLQFSKQDVFIKESFVLPNRTANGTLDGTSIKQTIMNVGTVGFTYGTNMSDFGKVDGVDLLTFYSSLTKEQYEAKAGEDWGGHAVQIIGWDDTISKDSFKDTNNNNAKPSVDGAWIIKNSWGNNPANKFYMSYDMKDIRYFNAYKATMDKSKMFDNNYQYDGVGMLAGVGYGGMSDGYSANIFTAQGNEVLESVSIQTFGYNQKYEIKVYTNVTDTTDPTSGTLQHTQSGVTAYKGYHTIDLSASVDLKKGEKFSVVLKLTPTKDGEYTIPIEMKSPGFSEVSIQPGQSFLGDGNAWQDLSGIGNPAVGNACIKAFTNKRSTLKDLTTAELTFTAPANLFFNNTAKTATVTAKNGVADVGAITVKYYDENNRVVTNPKAVGSYTVKVDVAETATYKVATNLEVGTFTISYITSPANITYNNETTKKTWYKNDVSLVSNGYQLSTSQTGTFSNSIIISENTSADYKVYAKDLNGNISDAIVIGEIKVDKVTPTGEITIKGNKFKEILNTITFGIFSLNTTDVKVTATDDKSGISKIEYAKVPSLVTDTSTLTFVDYSAFTISPTDTSVVYARFTDNAGNVKIINSTEVTTYQNSTADTTTVDFVKGTTANKDILVNLNGNTIKNITLNNAVVNNTNYTIAGNKITLKASYLETLSRGTNTFTITYNPNGKEFKATDKGDTPATSSFSVTIGLKDLTTAELTFTAPSNLFFNNTAKTATVTAKNGVADVGAITVKYYDENNRVVTNPKAVGSYTVKVDVAETATYKVATNLEVGTFTISYITSPANITYNNETTKKTWYKNDVSLVSNGYQLSTSQTGTFSNSIIISENTSADYKVYAKDLNGNISDAIVIGEIKVDKVTPTGEITIKGNKFKEILNTITFGIFSLNTTDVKVTATDDKSGISKIEYAKVPSLVTDTSTLTFVDYSAFTISPTDTSVVYARFTDNAGNVKIINSTEVTTYQNSTADTTTVDFVKGTTANKDILVNLNGNTIKNITLNNAVVNNTNYTIAGNKITLKASYLETLSRGTNTFTITYNPNGKEFKATDKGDTPATSSFSVTIARKDLVDSDIIYTAPQTLVFDNTAKTATVSLKAGIQGAGTITVQYYDAAANLVTEAKNVGTYTVKASVSEGASYNAYALKTVGTFTITKGDQTAPTGVSKLDCTALGLNDGKIIGVNNRMEYKKSTDIAYTAITANEVTGLASGTYDVRYKDTVNQNASPKVSVVIAVGKALIITTTNGEGYTVTTTDPKTVPYNGSFSFTVNVKAGYDKTKMVVKANNTTLTETAGKYTATNITANTAITVVGVADTKAPVVAVALDTNNWNSFLNTVTFGLFFKETKTLSVTATDTDGSGIAKTEYLVSDTPFNAVADVNGVWKNITGNSINLAVNSKQYVYVKSTDNKGNFAIVNTNGIVIYTDSELVTKTEEFNMDMTKDIEVSQKTIGNTVASIKNGTVALVEGTDFTQNENKVILKKEYLAKALTGDNLVLTFTFAPMGVKTDVVTLPTVDFTVTKHVHTFDNGVVTKEPTITEDGETTFTCTKCGFKKTTPIAKLESEVKTFEDKKEDVSVSGTFTKNAKLVITKAEKGNAEFDNIYKLIDESQMHIGAYTVEMVDGTYAGELTITFGVDAKYNGKTFTVYHEKKDGTIETFKQVAENGKVIIKVTELSPFMLTVLKDVPEVPPKDPETPTVPDKPNDTNKPNKPGTSNNQNPPQTGDTTPIYLYVFLLSVSLTAATFLLYKKRSYRPKFSKR
ncbi:MAG: lectin like domain-containing protein [Clostridia bacterium]